MAKEKKSTKRFKQKYLSDELKKRRRNKSKKVRLSSRATDDDARASASKPTAPERELASKDGVRKDLKDMDVDEFLSGGFLSFDGEKLREVEEVSDREDLLEDSPTTSDLEEDEEDEMTHGTEVEEQESDEEEGIDQGEVYEQNKSMKREAETHKAQLRELKQVDPEFYEYLEQTDTELLQFDVSDSEEEQEEERTSDKVGPTRRILTMEMVESWGKSVAEKRSLVAMKNLLRAYRSACHYGDSEESLSSSYNISSSNTFNTVMLLVLRESDGFFRKLLLGGSERKAAAKIIADPTDSPKWPKVEPLAKSFLGNSLHILTQMTDAQMISFTLRRLNPSIFLLNAFEKFQRKFLKATLGIMAREGDRSTRIQAVLFIRSMIYNLEDEFVDKALKGIYATFSSNAKFVTPASLPSIGFLSLAATEMYGIDVQASYRHAFAGLKQLAMLLRNALTTKTKDAYKAVYCWQTVNCLQLWCRILTTYTSNETLKPLVYPLVQLLLGTIRLVPTGRYAPLRLRLCHSANQLCASAGFYAPIVPILLETMNFSELSKPPKPVQGKPPDFSLVLKVSKSTLRTTTFHEECMFGSLELLAEHLSQWSYHVSFPELSHTCLLALKRFVKNSKVERFRKEARQFIAALEKNVIFVTSARDQVDFCPKDLSRVATFMAEERESRAAPMEVLYKTLEKKGQERRASKSISEISIPNGNHTVQVPAEVETKEEDDGDMGDVVFGGDWKPDGNHHVSDIPEGDQANGSIGSDSSDNSGDEVHELVLSSSDDDDDDIPTTRVVQRSQPKRKDKPSSTMPQMNKRNSGLAKHA